MNQKMGELRAAKAAFAQETAALNATEHRLDAAKAGLELARTVAKTVQETAHQQIADIVSRSLKEVFDDTYDFRILFEQKRGRTEARLAFIRNGVEVDPMSASGGGIVDVAAFALRLSCLLLSKPPLRRLIVLDEPMKFVSADYRPKVQALLHRLAKDLECQFLIVTHIAELKIGTIIHL